MFIAALILTFTYIGIAFAHVPKLSVDRPTAALAGAVLMVLFGVLTAAEAVAAIDFNTIALLLGMMVVVSALQAAGFFHLLAIKALTLATSPTRLLALVVIPTALCSAIFVNDAVVLLFTPIVIAACRATKANPLPYLIAEAMASNIGSTATIVGNPQNMLIGVAAGISFGRFFLYLLPVASLSILILLFIMRRIDSRELTSGFEASAPPLANISYDKKAVLRLVPVLAIVVIGFFASSAAGLGISLIALLSGAISLIVGKANPDEVLKGVNWPLLLFFAGLFVVIGGAQKAGVLEIFLDRISLLPDIGGITSVHAASAIMSQIVSNVPLAMLIIPLLKDIPGDTLWIALAAGTTLGGNLTIIGAIANIIVVESAAREGVKVGFGQFFRIGLLVTMSTVVLSILVLSLESWIGWLR